jgi:hypothetical protein
VGPPTTVVIPTSSIHLFEGDLINIDIISSKDKYIPLCPSTSSFKLLLYFCSLIMRA